MFNIQNEFHDQYVYRSYGLYIAHLERRKLVYNPAGVHYLQVSLSTYIKKFNSAYKNSLITPFGHKS